MARDDAGLTRLGPLGKGAMGEVTLAQEVDLRRRVAVKSLRAELAGDPAVVERFLREVRVTAQLDHPNIVPVYQMHGVDIGSPTYSMKLIQGQTLRELITGLQERVAAGEPIPPELSRTVRLHHFLKVCDAVHFAHDGGYMHRDLKPPNIMIGPHNEVYVMDWGIARALDGPPDSEIQVAALAETEPELLVERTRHGAILGSPPYMSPEQARGEQDRLGAHSDQYSLGLILFELVCLSRAIPGKRARHVLKHARAGTLAPVASAVAGETVPRELQAIIETATATDPEDRYPSVAALADDLRRFMADEPVVAAPDNRVQAVERWLGHHKHTALLTIAALLLAVLASSTALSLRNQSLQRDAAQREASLQQVLAQVAAEGQEIEEQFLSVAGLVHGLASAAEQLLVHGADSDAPVFFEDDFADPQTAPADLGPSARYRRDISLDQPVFVLAPGIDPDRVVVDLRRLLPLRHHLRRMMLRSSSEGALERERAVQDRILRVDGVPLVWAYVGLEAGVQVSFPGKSGYPDDFDPRLRPWYGLSRNHHGPRWGNPYMDALGMGRLLPCTMALHDEQGRLLGVAGVEMTFETIQGRLMDLGGFPGATAMHLLDEHGRVVISTAQGSVEVDGTGALALPPFGDPALVSAVIKGESGALTLDPDRLVVFIRLAMLDWTFAVEGPVDALLGVR